MKKITIAALATLMLGTVQADYTLKYPLEESRGGSLPNGSINIKTTLPDLQAYMIVLFQCQHPEIQTSLGSV